MQGLCIVLPLHMEEMFPSIQTLPIIQGLSCLILLLARCKRAPVFAYWDPWPLHGISATKGVVLVFLWCKTCFLSIHTWTVATFCGNKAEKLRCTLISKAHSIHMGTQLHHATAPFWPAQMSFLVKPGCELEGITNGKGSFWYRVQLLPGNHQSIWGTT